jgi:hypothetical protein
MILTIAQLLIFVIYVGYITYRFGILPSISDSHYKLNVSRKGYLFTIFCWALAITMVFQSDESTPLYFFSGAGLAFVGAASEFKWTGANTHIVHYLGAVLGIGCAAMGLYFESGLWQPSVIIVIFSAFCALNKTKNGIFWVEIVAFLAIIIGLIVR